MSSNKYLRIKSFDAHNNDYKWIVFKRLNTKKKHCYARQLRGHYIWSLQVPNIFIRRIQKTKNNLRKMNKQKIDICFLVYTIFVYMYVYLFNNLQRKFTCKCGNFSLIYLQCFKHLKNHAWIKNCILKKTTFDTIKRLFKFIN